MRRVLLPVLLAVVTTLGVVWAQQQTPQLPASSPVEVRPGQRPRPGEGREPEWPAPRITEYKPRTTLVVPAHPRPKAKFPVIDIHSHQPNPISAAEFARVVQGMEQNNLRLSYLCRRSYHRPPGDPASLRRHPSLLHRSKKKARRSGP